MLLLVFCSREDRTQTGTVDVRDGAHVNEQVVVAAPAHVPESQAECICIAAVDPAGHVDYPDISPVLALQFHGSHSCGVLLSDEKLWNAAHDKSWRAGTVDQPAFGGHGGSDIPAPPPRFHSAGIFSP
ncbi:MAG: hypothetical protein A4E39_01630 [Methanoregulaceae archaeon PtaB.Bin152]|nr:MAG: hypothetical protein A4E39_01630 [Methanoregulaceae archaeon PtaB.Bin152]